MPMLDTCAAAQRFVATAYHAVLDGLPLLLSATVEHSTPTGAIVVVQLTGTLLVRVLVHPDGRAELAPKEGS